MSFQKSYEQAKADYKPMNRTQITRATGKRLSAFRRAKRTREGDAGKEIKAEMDQLVRDIIALRDGYCFTCDATGGVLHVGHLFRRGLEATRWNLLNNHAQCDPCNGVHEYEPEIYIGCFVQRYGAEAYAELRALSRKSQKISYTELLNLRDGLRNELAKLKEANS